MFSCDTGSAYNFSLFRSCHMKFSRSFYYTRIELTERDEEPGVIIFFFVCSVCRGATITRDHAGMASRGRYHLPREDGKRFIFLGRGGLSLLRSRACVLRYGCETGAILAAVAVCPGLAFTAATGFWGRDAYDAEDLDASVKAPPFNAYV